MNKVAWGIGCVSALLFFGEIGLSKDWDLIKVDGKEYVSAENVGRFYKFNKVEITDNGGRRFSHDKMRMSWEPESDIVVINKVNFRIDEPLVKKDNQILLHTLGLVSLDAVIRPGKIKPPFALKTVVLDFGCFDDDDEPLYSNAYHLDFLKTLGNQLKERGLNTITPRADDKNPDTESRIKIANEADNNIFVNIRFGITQDKEQPLTTIPLNTKLKQFRAHSNALATAVHAHISHKIENTLDKGVRLSRNGKLPGLEGPGVVIHCGLPAAAAPVVDEEQWKSLANAICEGIESFQTATRAKADQ